MIYHIWLKILDIFFTHLHKIIDKILQLLIPELQPELNLILISYVKALEVL